MNDHEKLNHEHTKIRKRPRKLPPTQTHTYFSLKQHVPEKQRADLEREVAWNPHLALYAADAKYKEAQHAEAQSHEQGTKD